MWHQSMSSNLDMSMVSPISELLIAKLGVEKNSLLKRTRKKHHFVRSSIPPFATLSMQNCTVKSLGFVTLSSWRSFYALFIFQYRKHYLIGIVPC